MNYIIWLLVIFALMHFVYSGIILPSIRSNLRFELFALRDQLKSLKISHSSDLPDDVFKVMHGLLNNTIRSLPVMDLPTIAKVERRLKADNKLKQEAERRLQIIKECEIEEIKLIIYSVFQVYRKALIANSVPWLFYTLPFAVAIFIIGILNGFVSDIKRDIKLAMSLPEKEIISFVPDDELTLNC